MVSSIDGPKCETLDTGAVYIKVFIVGVRDQTRVIARATGRARARLQTKTGVYSGKTTFPRKNTSLPVVTGNVVGSGTQEYYVRVHSHNVMTYNLT